MKTLWRRMGLEVCDGAHRMFVRLQKSEPPPRRELGRGRLIPCHRCSHSDAAGAKVVYVSLVETGR
jgi:hypothetical protein